MFAISQTVWNMYKLFSSHSTPMKLYNNLRFTSEEMGSQVGKLNFLRLQSCEVAELRFNKSVKHIILIFSVKLWLLFDLILRKLYPIYFNWN